MAKMKDENKKKLILDTSKTLFSQKGFFNTSISDIVNETGLPAGSIYTYFTNKESIIKTIVESGWLSLKERLIELLDSKKSVKTKFIAIINDFIPELFNDLDLINIILTEAIEYTRIEEKIEELTNIIYGLIKSLADKDPNIELLDKKDMEAALIIYFLGIMNTMKLSKSSSIEIDTKNVMNFVRISVEKSLNIKL